MKLKLFLLYSLCLTPVIACYAQIPYECNNNISCSIDNNKQVTCRSSWPVSRVHVHGNPAVTEAVTTPFNNAQGHGHGAVAHCNYTTYSRYADPVNYINVETTPATGSYSPDSADWKSKWVNQGNGSWTCNGPDFDSNSDDVGSNFNCSFYKISKAK